MNPCPICGQEAETTCRCKRGECTCKNGHDWHYCGVHEVPVLGHVDHSIPLDQCTCKAGVKAKVAKKLSLDHRSFRVAFNSISPEDVRTQPGQVVTDRPYTQEPEREDMLEQDKDKLEETLREVGVLNPFFSEK